MSAAGQSEGIPVGVGWSSALEKMPDDSGRQMPSRQRRIGKEPMVAAVTSHFVQSSNRVSHHSTSRLFSHVTSLHASNSWSNLSDWTPSGFKRSCQLLSQEGCRSANFKRSLGA